MESKEVFVGFLFKNKNDKVFYGCKRTSMLENENIHDFMERIIGTVDNTGKGRVSQLAVYESENKKYYCSSTEFGAMKYTVSEDSDDVYFTTKTPMFVYLNEKYFNIITTGDSASVAYKECNLILQYPKLIANVILPINENYVSSQTHSLFDFIINTLNINFHPDDNFEDYLVNDSIVDIDGKILEFDEASLKYIQAQIGLCFEYLEDDIYQIGFDLIKSRIRPDKFDSDIFIEELENKMSWNNCTIYKTDSSKSLMGLTVGEIIPKAKYYFLYECLPGSSISKQLSKSIKEIGYDSKIKPINVLKSHDTHLYLIGIL